MKIYFYLAVAVVFVVWLIGYFIWVCFIDDEGEKPKRK
jgi:hypothetical protein